MYFLLNIEYGNRSIVESLVTLEEQYEVMKNISNGRCSLKKSIHLKGVPHACITLNSKASQESNSAYGGSLKESIHWTSNRSNVDANHFKIVSIGSRCAKNHNHHKSM